VFGVIRLVQARIFRFDYLMPAELLPVALIGGGVLLWAALRRHKYHKLIAWGLVAAMALLGVSQGLAKVTGLASGATPATGLPWALALGAIIGYDLALGLVGVAGILLVRELFKG
jgi:hypothetical protein